MSITEIMVVFKNPDTIHTLSAGDKFLGVGFTMVLGMGITFISLVLLKFVMEIMAKVLDEKKVPQSVAPIVAKKTEEPVEETAVEDDQAIIAAITVALATKLKTPLSNIIIRDIKKVNRTGNSWNQSGIIEQMNNRL